jgi:hypothetical protein
MSANTFSIEENARESARLYALLDNGIRERLMRYPGVRHVSVGLKIRGNDLLWERSFHVYVDKKVSIDELGNDKIIPPDIDGVKTDVHEIGVATLAASTDPSPCEDRTRYRPIKGGISISNGMEIPIQLSPTVIQIGALFGTLGVIGRIEGPCECNTVALTNWHVLYIGRRDVPIVKGSRVFQPYATNNEVTNLSLDTYPDPNTHVNDMGEVVDGIFNGTVDCGLVKVNRSCSNCCGVPYENVIRGLETISPMEFNGIQGEARANTGDQVFFVGAKSGPTKAIVVTDSAPKDIPPYPNVLVADPRISPDILSGDLTMPFTGQIKLVLADTTPPHLCNAVVNLPTYTGPPFSRVVDHGDSGSLLLNGQNMAVGLVFASDDAIPTTAPFTLYGYANHYAEVTAALRGIGLNFAINYTQPSTGGSSGTSISTFAESENDRYLSWKNRVEEHPASKAIADAVVRHRDEVLLLINHCRPVTVAWHRGKGPAFTAVIMNNVRAEKFDFPEVLQGVSAVQLLTRMRDILLEHGSSGLKDDLVKLQESILTAVSGKNSFEDVLAALKGKVPISTH